MVNAKKLGLVGRILLAGSAAVSGGCVGEEGGFIDPYAVAGAGLKSASGFSQSAGAGAGLYAFGEGVQATGQYNANERAAQAGRSEVNVYNGRETRGTERINNSQEEEEEENYAVFNLKGEGWSLPRDYDYEKFLKENPDKFKEGYKVTRFTNGKVTMVIYSSKEVQEKFFCQR